MKIYPKLLSNIVNKKNKKNGGENTTSPRVAEVINGNSGCGRQQPGGLTAEVGLLGVRVGGRLTTSLHSSNEPDELFN